MTMDAAKASANDWHIHLCQTGAAGLWAGSHEPEPCDGALRVLAFHTAAQLPAYDVAAVIVQNC